MTIDDLRQAYRTLFDSADGKIVLDDMDIRFHMKSSTYVPDSNEAAFREGQRSVLLFLHNMLADQPEREDIANDE